MHCTGNVTSFFGDKSMRIASPLSGRNEMKGFDERILERTKVDLMFPLFRITKVASIGRSVPSSTYLDLHFESLRRGFNGLIDAVSSTMPVLKFQVSTLNSSPTVNDSS